MEDPLIGIVKVVRAVIVFLEPDVVKLQGEDIYINNIHCSLFNKLIFLADKFPDLTLRGNNELEDNNQVAVALGFYFWFGINGSSKTSVLIG